MEPTKIALIPAYEPDEKLPELVRALWNAGLSIVVVDDGSGPDYAELFREAGRVSAVLTHETNLGKGRALKTGLAHIYRQYAADCVAVTLDADGQHRAGDALRLCALAADQPDALILGSRRLSEHVPLRSQFGNTLTRFVYHLTTGLRIHDTQTGLRAFGGGLIPALLAIPGDRYEYEMNVLLTFARRGIPIREYEIETVYIDGNAGSHFDALRDSFRVYREILRFSASSFLGFLVDYSLYGILLAVTGNLPLSNVGARIVSASVNYTVNRRFVFRSRAGIRQSAPRYFLLAAAILAANTALLTLLADCLGVHRLLAKLITELLLFLISWLAQRLFVFRREAA